MDAMQPVFFIFTILVMLVYFKATYEQLDKIEKQQENIHKELQEIVKILVADKL